MIEGLTRRQFQDLVLSVGTHRTERRLSPLEVAQLIQTAVNTGMTRSECADILDLGTTQVSTFLKLLKLPRSIRYLADWGGKTNASISFSTMAELTRLAPSDQIEAAEAILKYRLKWKEVVQLVQIKIRSSSTLIEAINTVLRLRPRIIKQYLFLGAVYKGDQQKRLGLLSASQRSVIFDSILLQLVGRRSNIVGNLGTENFTIVSTIDLAESLGQQPDELEQQVNGYLGEALGTL